MAATAKAAPPAQAEQAQAAAEAAREAAEATLDSVPENARAYGMCMCGSDLGSDAYVAAKLKQIESTLCGSGTKEGKLEATTSALATIDPHVAHTAINY